MALIPPVEKNTVYPTCCIFGVRIDTLPLPVLLSEIAAAASTTAPIANIADGGRSPAESVPQPADPGTPVSAATPAARRLLIVHANITGLNLAWEQHWLREFYNQADRVYCDGMGVQLGARLLRQPPPPRYTMADWAWQLAEKAAISGFSLYLLGNPPGVAEHAAARLKAQAPFLQIAGARDGYFDKVPGCEENTAVVAEINARRPGVLLVGFGMPLQERWLVENWSCLEVPVAITVGALFEYLSGDLPRGLRWMTQNYMEWLARLLISPRRYARRYLRDIPLFFSRLFRQASG